MTQIYRRSKKAVTFFNLTADNASTYFIVANRLPSLLGKPIQRQMTPKWKRRDTALENFNKANEALLNEHTKQKRGREKTKKDRRNRIWERRRQHNTYLTLFY